MLGDTSEGSLPQGLGMTLPSGRPQRADSLGHRGMGTGAHPWQPACSWLTRAFLSAGGGVAPALSSWSPVWVPRRDKTPDPILGKLGTLGIPHGDCEQTERALERRGLASLGLGAGRLESPPLGALSSC